MKKLILTLLLLPTLLFAEGEIIVPEVTDSYHVTCNYPIQREDGSILLLNEIANVQFHLNGPDITPVVWQLHSTNIIACEAFIDLTSLNDGQYYLTATTMDIDGRISNYSVDTLQSSIGSIAFEIQHLITSPKPPSGLIGSAFVTVQ